MNKKLIIGALIGVGIVIVALVLWLNPELRARLWSMKKPELPPQIIVGSFVDAQLYELSGDMLRHVSVASEGSVTSRTRRADVGTASSVFLPVGTLGNEIILEKKEGSEVLDLPFSIKDTPTFSFDGTHLAYAELAPELVGMLYSEEVSDWRIQVVNLETQKITDLGAGFAPYFISDSPRVLLFSTPEGVTSVNLENGERVVHREFPVLFTPHAAHVSPNGEVLVVYNPTTRHYSIFSITDPSSFQVSALGEVPVLLSPVALTNATLYGVHRDETTNVFTLWKYPLKELQPLVANGTLIYTFEANIIPYQLVP